MTEPADQNKELAREVRADGREVRADGREGRADVREGGASRRDDRADQREDRAVGREKRAVGRDGTLHRLVKVLIWMTAVLSILTVVSVARSFVVQDAVERVESQEELNIATGRETLKELRAAVESIETEAEGPGINAEAVAEALLAIGRIEAFLCGGPCPPDE